VCVCKSIRVYTKIVASKRHGKLQEDTGQPVMFYDVIRTQ